MNKIKSNRRDFIKSITVFGTMSMVPGTMLASCDPKEASNQKYDLVIYGATPGGVACAIRAAREGLDVLLISFNDRIGGMLTSGLGVWDTLYEGHRSGIYNELRQTFFDYYKSTYGEDSQVYKDALPGKTGHNNGTFEAHVAERLINELVNSEAKITTLLNHYPVAVSMKGNTIRSIELQEMDKENTIKISGDFFSDCSYEGDLMAVAKVKYRVGRESKNEFNEKHAGEVYMLPNGKNEWSDRDEEVFKGLNIRQFGHHQSVAYPESTHRGDSKVQAFNMRYYVTKDPNNQIDIQPSSNYDPKFLKTLEFGRPRPIKPNSKCGTNRPQLVGMHNQYVEGDWRTRKEVIRKHVEATRDMIYFIQNDHEAPEALKKQWKGWGLAKDEYADNDNNPYEIYVREARRLVGKYVYTENDLILQGNYARARVHPDSIGFTDWYMDSHACTFKKVEEKGTLHEGKMMMHKETFMGQFPFRSLLSDEINNLIVPVCVSCTHVAWGAIRLEPTWMQFGESAALAVVLAKDNSVQLDKLKVDDLVKKLADDRSMISFFNDFTVDDPAEWVPAVQYFGTKGFFPTYDARPNDPVDEQTAVHWIRAVRELLSDNLNIHKLLKNLMSITNQSGSIPGSQLNELLQDEGISKLQKEAEQVSRAQLCQHLYQHI